MEFRDFPIVLEEDAGGNGWHACYQPREDLGVATCGDTREAAIHNIKEVLSMIVAEIRQGYITWEEVVQRGGIRQTLASESSNSLSVPIAVS